MSASEIMTLCAMIAYLIFIVVVGFLFSKKNKTSEEFYLGGRGLGPWVTAMSAEASDMSGWLLMGLPGAAFLTGPLDYSCWIAVGLAIGTYVNWRITALRLRTYTQVANNSITIPDYFSNRFHDKKKILMTIAAIFIIIFFIPYTAAGFVACGKLFTSLFGFEYVPAMIVSAIIIITYTIVGGFLAESVVDFIQGTLMFIVLITVVGMGVSAVGGLSNVYDQTSHIPGYYSVLPAEGYEGLSVITVLSGLAWGLGYFGMPHVLLRFMAIRKPRELSKSRRIGITWCVISLIMAIMIGVVGRALFVELPAGIDEENIFILMTKELMSGGLMPILAGIALCGILAAQISSSDSQLLVASSAVSQNIFKGLVKPKASNKQVMIAARVTILIMAIAAILLALDPQSSILEIVDFAWGGFGATFGPLVLFSLFWKRTNVPGAIAGMIVGGATVLIWELVLLPAFGGIFELYSLLPAFILSCLAIFIVSKLTKEPEQSVKDEFAEYLRQMAQYKKNKKQKAQKEQ